MLLWDPGQPCKHLELRDESAWLAAIRRINVSLVSLDQQLVLKSLIAAF